MLTTVNEMKWVCYKITIHLTFYTLVDIYYSKKHQKGNVGANFVGLIDVYLKHVSGKMFYILYRQGTWGKRAIFV